MFVWNSSLLQMRHWVSVGLLVKMKIKFHLKIDEICSFKIITFQKSTCGDTTSTSVSYIPPLCHVYLFIYLFLILHNIS